MIEPGKREQHPRGVRQRPAGKTRPRTPRHYRHTTAFAGLENLDNLLFCFRQRNRERHTAISRQGIALVGLEFLSRLKQAMPRQDLPQCSNDRIPVNVGKIAVGGRVGWKVRH